MPPTNGFFATAVNAARAVFGSGGDVSYGQLLNGELRKMTNTVDHPGTYEYLRSLYYNDRAYRADSGDNLILGLRNPTRAVCDFYAATMWPGTLPEALPIETDLQDKQATNLIAAIHQVWDWSNWNAEKQVYARNSPMLGDSLVKVATRSDAAGNVQRVYLRQHKPDYLTDFDTDERGFLTYIRLDVPRQRRNGDEIKQYTHTEVWDKANMRYRVWEHDRGKVGELSDLGQPVRDEDIESFGIDFIPFVHSKHIDLGDARGIAAITPALVKTHELNRMTSELHHMMFQYGKADIVLHSNLVDQDGLPMPPPLVDDDGDELELGGSRVLRLPSGWDFKHLIANLNYEQFLQAVRDMEQHLQQSELPELTYYGVAETREMSGTALRLVMKPAIAKAEEARGNAEAALIRANQMALTIGKYHKLTGFTELGEYHNGDFGHTFMKRDVIELDEAEKATIAKTNADAALNQIAAGWSPQETMRRAGLTDADILKMQAEKEVSEAERGERLLRMDRAGGVDREQ